jgi:hypothetical protein
MYKIPQNSLYFSGQNHRKISYNLADKTESYLHFGGQKIPGS